MAAMSMLSPWFLSGENLLGMTRHLTEMGIIGCGMTFIIMSGGIDLSVGSLVGLAGIVLGYTWQAWGLVPALVLTIGTGLIGGSLNGVLITRLKLPPLIVTLATMALFRGLAITISKAQPVSNFPETFGTIGQGEIAGIPVQFPIWILVVGLAFWTIKQSRIGRAIAAIGNNERAAEFAALSVNRIKFQLYAAMGVLCAISAIILTSRMSTAKADAGINLELDVITAVVLGGTPIVGGPGSVVGTFLGVLILGVVRNGLSLAGVSSVWQTMLSGIILVTAAVLNSKFSKK